MRPREGEILAGKYRVERVIGEGGFGVVVAAIHLQLRQRVALKFLLPHALSEASVVERFLREARAMAGIRSQHAARVIDIGTLLSGAPFIVMEYLEGEDLGEVLEKHGPLPVPSAVSSILQACEAIGEAHAIGIVHRDLKPANLFRARGPGGAPVIKVLDFGISKLSFERDELALTKSHAMLGSPVYASPEQLRSTKSADHRSDVWSLGVTLYHLVSGVVPFTGETIADLAIKVALDPIPPLPPHLHVPAALETIIRRCLEKEPRARYQNVDDLAADLSSLGQLDQGGLRRGASRLPAGSTQMPAAPAATTQRAAAGEVTFRAREAATGRSRRLALTMAASLVLIGIGGAALRALRDAHGPSAGTASSAPAAELAADASPTATLSEDAGEVPSAAAPPSAAASPPDAGATEAGPTTPPSPMAARPLPPAPRSYAELVKQANRLAGRGSCVPAQRLYEAALEVRPGGIEALTGIGACQLAQGRHDEALLSFRAALGIERHSPDALFGIAEASRRKGDRAEAIAHYRRYLEVAAEGRRAESARRSLESLERLQGPDERSPATRPPVAPEEDLRIKLPGDD